jgi:hypothetical protein
LFFNKTIQRLAAGVMLVLFAISIAPKQLLHDAVAGHKHSYAKFDTDPSIRTHKSSFQCNWNHQSIESPFTDQPDFQIDHPVIHHASPVNYYTLSDYSAERSLTSLRGPPCLA